MIRAIAIVFLLFHSINKISARIGFGDTEQDWGYITVRPNAHMFWWLYYTTNDAKNYTETPLIIWIQGGPGMPSSGYGNFVELGPLTPSLEIREDSPVKHFNILFVDNPVGTGYSYFSDDEAKPASNGDEIGRDLYHFLKGFLNLKPEFTNVPLYVFGESYGGKMATDLVYHITRANKTICNLKGLGLGAAYVSPAESTLQYAPLAYHLGLIDKRQFERLDRMAKAFESLINRNEMEAAAELGQAVYGQFYAETYGKIDMYNFITKTNGSRPPSLYDSEDILNELMNDKVKKKLEIPDNVKWRFAAYRIRDALKDLKASDVNKIEYLLNKTDVKVIVYNGVLDIIVNTAGTISWIEKMKWQGAQEWLNSDKELLEIDRIYEGYYKRAKNLVFYAILRSGHSAPVDNLPAMNEILRRELLA